MVEYFVNIFNPGCQVGLRSAGTKFRDFRSKIQQIRSSVHRAQPPSSEKSKITQNNIQIQPTKPNAQRLDGLQRKFVSQILHLQPNPADTVDTFCQRKWATVRRCINHYGKPFSRMYCTMVVKWLEHLDRHPCTLPNRVRSIADHVWRERRRRLMPNAFGTRLGTRKTVGQPIRWMTDFIETHPWNNKTRNEVLTDQRVFMLLRHLAG